MQRLDRGLARLYAAFGVAGALFLATIAVLVCLSIVARQVDLYVPGLNRYTGYAMAAASFFALAYTFHAGGHIRVEMLLNKLGPRGRRPLEIWCHAVAFAFAAYLAFYLTRMTWVSFELGDVSDGSDVTPLWIPQIAAALGAIALALAIGHHLVLTVGRSIVAGLALVALVAAAAFLMPIVASQLSDSLDKVGLTLLFIALLFLLLGTGVWVAVSLGAVAIVGMALFTSRPIGDAMATTIWGASSSWTLTALPLFIWMGEILFRTRLSENLFRGLTPWMARLPGGLLHVNIGGSALFAAISGSSAATVATVGKMSIPELRKRGYPERMIIGTLAGAGTLGLLIPPSITMIIYGVTVNLSITKLFMAGILPGIMLAGMFMLFVAGWALLRYRRSAEERYSWADKLRAAVSLLPILLLILFVLGAIYRGWATATEAAVLGVIGALLISGFQGELNRRTFIESLLGATRTSAMIAFILAGSAFMSLAMGFTGLPRALAEWIAAMNLTPTALIVVLTAFYIVLGCFLDGISAIVLTMAVIEPLVRQAGFDMIWFGIYLALVVEMAQITPPVGFNLFVLQGMTNHDMGFIARAAAPMFVIMVLAVVIIVLVPEIATLIPDAMVVSPG